MKEILKWTSMALSTAVLAGGTAYGVIVAWQMLQSPPPYAERPAAERHGVTTI